MRYGEEEEGGSWSGRGKPLVPCLKGGGESKLLRKSKLLVRCQNLGRVQRSAILLLLIWPLLVMRTFCYERTFPIW